MNITFITGNQHKADYLAKWLDMPIRHQKIDLDELQSLDLREIAAHKAHQAYDKIQTTVLVEDGALTFLAMGRLPGPLVKWFIEEIGNDGLCKMVSNFEDRSAVATLCYALFDGKELHFFEGSVHGKVSEQPRGDNGFGWNPIFIPNGSDKTYAEMTDDELKPFSFRAQAIQKLAEFLKNEQT